MKYIKNIIRTLRNMKREAVEAGLVDFSGQGRNEYGK